MTESTEDLEGLKQAFALFDRDRDGEIDKENVLIFCLINPICLVLKHYKSWIFKHYIENYFYRMNWQRLVWIL